MQATNTHIAIAFGVLVASFLFHPRHQDGWNRSPSRSGSSQKVSRKGEPDVFHIAHDDREMNEATDRARASVQEFIRELGTQFTGSRGHSIKVAIDDGQNTEYLWTTRPTIEGANFKALLSNQPTLTRGFKEGEPVTRPITTIIDWMYIDVRNRLVGGYTLRVLRSRTSPEERKKFDHDISFWIE